MIIVRIIGGLGNQMFQFALITALQEAGIEVKADITDFGKKGLTLHNGFELENIFKIYLNKANKHEINRVKNNKSFRYYLRRIKGLLFSTPLPHLREGKFPSERLKGDKSSWKNTSVYFDGYWQSELFFSEVQNKIKEELKFPAFKDEKNIAAEKDIKNSNSVSLHIRGGDYISTPELFNLYGCVCDAKYYNKSIQYIRENTEMPHFFIFSNDFNWVRKNINIDSSDSTITDWNNGSESFRDMQLMSLCRHQILANSSFSWWSNFLNDNTGITISPSLWTSRNDHLDIFRPKWIKL